MNVSEMKPGHWDSMVNTANPKTGKAHAFLGVSKKNGKTYIHNFADKAALKSGGYRMMSLPEIHEISHQIFTSPDCDSAIFGSTRQALAGFVDAKKDKLALAKAAIIYNLFFSVVKYLAYALLITYAVGRKIGNSQHTKQICLAEINQAECMQSTYDKSAATIRKTKTYAGENFLTLKSKEFLMNTLREHPKLIELFDQFVDAAIEAKKLNLAMLAKNDYQLPSTVDACNQNMIGAFSNLSTDIAQVAGNSYNEFKDIAYRMIMISGCPSNTQFNIDNFVFAIEKGLSFPKAAGEAYKPPSVLTKDRYIKGLLADSNLYDYEKLAWMEENWGEIKNDPDRLDKEYPAPGSRERVVPSEVSPFEYLVLHETSYQGRLERLLAKCADSSYDGTKIKEAVLKMQSEHGYFAADSLQFITKAEWRMNANDSGVFETGTRTIGLMNRNREIAEFKVNLDLKPLGELSHDQCRAFFAFMARIDGDGSLASYQQEKMASSELSADVKQALGVLDWVADAQKRLVLGIAADYNHQVNRGIALLFANKKW